MNSKSVLGLMKSDKAKKIISDCPLKKAVISLDPEGKVKKPCVLGSKVDCSRCGCIIPYQVESAIIRKQLESFSITKKGFIG